MLNETSPEFTRSRLWQILRAVLLVLLLMTGFFAFAQRSMIYFPAKEKAERLKEIASLNGLIPWNNSAGELIGYRTAPLPASPKQPISFLLFHGNAGNALHRISYIHIFRDALPDLAVSVFLLEYPGYGARGGSPSQSDFLDAAANALDALPSDAPVILVGESIGTGVATGTAAAHPDRIHSLLLLTPFDSLSSTAQFHYPFLPIRWILRDKFPSDEWLQKFHCPVSFVLAEKDSIVPADLGKTLYNSYSGPKLLHIAEGANHNDLLNTLSASDWRSILSPLVP